MTKKSLVRFSFLIAFALFSYSSSNAQIVDAVKKAADKTKDVTVDAAKKTAEVTKDAAEATPEIAEKTGEATKNAAKATGSGVKRVGGYTIKVTDNVVESAAAKSYQSGKWLTTTTWDGTKWVSKRVWYATKKTGTATKNAVVGESSPKP
jgi:hypothetical protein